MLIRFIAKNIYSFQDQTEFSLFPGNSGELLHHTVQVNHFELVRFSAVYGANGSGKSNLIKAIHVLKTIVEKGTLDFPLDKLKFKLSEETQKSPVSLGIEFLSEDTTFYYTITFDENVILHEYLAITTHEEDHLKFERVIQDGKQTIQLNEEYLQSERQKIFIEVISDKILQQNELLFTFLSYKYANDFRTIVKAFRWFKKLVIVRTNEELNQAIQFLDLFPDIKEYANSLIPKFNTGIQEIGIKKEKFENNPENNISINEIKEDLKKRPFLRGAKIFDKKSEELISLFYEDNEFISKQIVTKRVNADGKSVEFGLSMESDGTRRLIDLIPYFYGAEKAKVVLVIDEIERSIHPLLIKKIISILSQSKTMNGQLIFTSHESNLLDLKLFRSDEIWFTEKDQAGATRLYSLSDFKIYEDLKLENGYLQGRFGGIPFLGKLSDLEGK